MMEMPIHYETPANISRSTESHSLTAMSINYTLAITNASKPNNSKGNRDITKLHSALSRITPRTTSKSINYPTYCNLTSMSLNYR